MILKKTQEKKNLMIIITYFIGNKLLVEVKRRLSLSLSVCSCVWTADVITVQSGTDLETEAVY